MALPIFSSRAAAIFHFSSSACRRYSVYDSTTQSQIEVLHTLVENLRSNEKEYARVLNDVPIVVLMLDVRGRILFLNHAWSELSGYSSIDATGQPLAMFLAHPEEDQVLPASKLIAVADKPIKKSGMSVDS